MKTNLIFDDIKCRLDRQAIQDFHDQWQLQFYITTEELIDLITIHITRVIQNNEIDSETWINFGENGKYEIELSFDRETEECWMYPIAYGIKLEEHVVMILSSKCAITFFDKSKVNVKSIESFSSEYQIGQIITPNTIIKWIEDDLASRFNWPADMWQDHTFTTPEQPNEPQHIGIHYYTEDGARYIDIHPVMYNNILFENCYWIYKDGENNGQ